MCVISDVTVLLVSRKLVLCAELHSEVSGWWLPVFSWTTASMWGASGCSSTPPGHLDNAENRLHITSCSFLLGARDTLREYRTYSGSWDDLQVCKVFEEVAILGLTCAAYKTVVKLTLLC